VITIRNSQHLARTMRTLRETNGMSRAGLAKRLFVSTRTVINRELSSHAWHTDALVDAANILGHDLVLMPQRRPSVRYTGTGWPA